MWSRLRTFSPRRPTWLILGAAIVYVVAWLLVAFSPWDALQYRSFNGGLPIFVIDIGLPVLVGLAIARWWAAGLALVPGLLYLVVPGALATCFGTIDREGGFFGDCSRIPVDFRLTIGAQVVQEALVAIVGGVLLAWFVAAVTGRRGSAIPEA